MTSPIQEAGPNAGGRTLGSQLLTGSLIAAVLLYVGLLASPSVPFIGIFVWIYSFCASYFWVYLGVPAAIVVFLITCLVSRRIFRKRRHCLRLALQLSAITFATVGIGLMATVPLVGGYELHMGGFRLHARIWLDVDRVRSWANQVDLSQDSALSPAGWPLTVKIMALPAGRVDVDEGTRDVTIYQGSALSGHWGVHITARGKDWAGKRWADYERDPPVEKLEDGAWIWSSFN